MHQELQLHPWARDGERKPGFFWGVSGMEKESMRQSTRPPLPEEHSPQCKDRRLCAVKKHEKKKKKRQTTGALFTPPDASSQLIHQWSNARESKEKVKKDFENGWMRGLSLTQSHNPTTWKTLTTTLPSTTKKKTSLTCNIVPK